MEEISSLEQLIESEHRVALIETASAEPIFEQFKRIALTTGRAIYGWNPEHGLYRLGVSHIFIPRTRTPVDVLAYISSSRHYGVYLLNDFGDALAKPAVQRQLQNIVEKADNVRRLVILTGQRMQPGSELAPHVVRLRHQAAQQVG